jgi:glycosyltransferase involved in cell wall biosynthesis
VFRSRASKSRVVDFPFVPFMQFSIVTPSFRNSEWLKLCVASVADQGVELEHIVQDSCSDDGTQEWLPNDSRVKAFVEKDKSMYDAVNRGLLRAKGEILGYINCDEQYLPGALNAVRDFFLKHPEIEVLFSDTIVVNAEGTYLCHRRALVPDVYHSWLSGNLAILTCATFFRRSLVDRRGIFFEPSLRYIGDVVWVLKLLENKVPMAVLPRFTSIFTETGDNMSTKPNANREKAELAAKAPSWARRACFLFVLHYRLRRLLAGYYWQKPFDFAIYTRRSPIARLTSHVSKPTTKWSRPSVPQQVLIS